MAHILSEDLKRRIF